MDLFAAAIILFVILTQRPPFSCANPQDPHYRLIAAGRPELFWQAHAQAEDGVDIYSPEFKDFFEKMMTLNPSHRPTMEQVLQHPWISAERGVPTYEEIKVDFQRRKQLVEAEAHNEREEKRHKRGQAHEARVVSRSGAQNEEGEMTESPQDAWRSLEVEEYGPCFHQDYTQFFMTGEPLDYFEDLTKHLQEEKV